MKFDPFEAADIAAASKQIDDLPPDELLEQHAKCVATEAYLVDSLEQNLQARRRLAAQRALNNIILSALDQKLAEEQTSED